MNKVIVGLIGLVVGAVGGAVVGGSLERFSAFQIQDSQIGCNVIPCP